MDKRTRNFNGYISILYRLTIKGNRRPILALKIYMKIFLNSDWLRALQFYRNTTPRKKYMASAKTKDILNKVSLLRTCI
jgi:hypothetical protein